MWFWNRKQPTIPYDPEKEEPVIRQSICTPEKVGGLLDKSTGRFREIMLLNTREDVAAFAERLGMEADQVRTIY